MMKFLNKFLKDFLPPILYRFLRILVSPYKLSSQENILHHENYDNQLIAEQVILNEKLLNQNNISIRKNLDKFAFRSLPGIISSIKRNSLRVVDFGGGSGSQYFFLRKLLSDDIQIEWTIVETSNIVKAAHKHFDQNDELHFTDSLEEIIKDNKKYDLLFSSCAFHYLDNPFLEIKKFLSIEADFAFFTRMPLNHKSNENIYVRQKSYLNDHGSRSGVDSINRSNKAFHMPLQILSMELFEEVLSDFGNIIFHIKEEESCIYTKKGIFDMHGYLLDLRKRG